MLKRNLIANYLGQGWTALMGLAFIPTYIHYLGIEAYGLIGLFGILQACLVLLDMGMTPALSRQMALFTGGAESAAFIRDLMRSIEIIIFGVTCIVGLSIWLISDWLVSDWLRLDKLTFDTARNAICIIGIVVALRFFESIYRSALMGLQRQVEFNIVNSGLATLRGLGAVAILMWIAPTIEAFFIWQGSISILSVGVLAALTYRSIPKVERGARFSMSALSRIYNFALGMTCITFLSLVLMQTDKVILSKFLPLSEFGYYTLAATVAGTLYMVVSPIGQAWFPRLTELNAEASQVSLIEKYHQGAQLVSVLMGTTALIIIVFSETILEVWTNNVDLAHQSANLLRILALGNLFNGLMWIPYQTQLAFGWTSLSLRINLISVAIIIPALVFLIPRYGAEGGAWVWVGLNAGYVLIGIQFMFRKILTTEKWKWYKEDVFMPLSVATTVSATLAWAMPENLPHLYKVVWILAISFVTMISAAIGCSQIRKFAITQLRPFLKFM